MKPREVLILAIAALLGSFGPLQFSLGIEVIMNPLIKNRTGSQWQSQVARTGKTLLYNHMPKTGGSTIRKYLADAEIKHLIVSEFKKTLNEDMSKYFIIGSVRSPCNYYLSLYSFGRDGHGALRDNAFKKNITESRLIYGGSFQSGFKLFVEQNGGVESSRFIQSYPDMAVDCFVRTELLAGDLARCLEIYELRGGNKEYKFDRAHLHQYFSDSGTVRNPSHHPTCHSFFFRNSAGVTAAKNATANANANANVAAKRGTAQAPLFVHSEYTQNEADALRLQIMRHEAHIINLFPEYKQHCCGSKV